MQKNLRLQVPYPACNERGQAGSARDFMQPKGRVGELAARRPSA